jgi:hypothetical protein
LPAYQQPSPRPVDLAEPMVSCRVLAARFLNEFLRDFHGSDLE